MAVHDHLRSELAQVVRAVQVAVTDARRAQDARALVREPSSGVDPAAVGSSCRRWCRVVELVQGGVEQTGAVAAALQELETDVLSHLALEERELLDPIARLGIRV